MKMLEAFVHPNPTDEQIEHYGQRFVDIDWNIKTVLREMLTSKMFFSEWAYRSKIKSPAELVIGSAVAMGGKPNMQFLRESMAKMGQNILFPPNVKGWDGEEAWINSNTVLVRFNFGMAIATQRNPGGSEPMARQNDLETPLKSMNDQERRRRHRRICPLCSWMVNFPTARRKSLTDYMNRDRNDQPKAVGVEQGHRQQQGARHAARADDDAGVSVGLRRSGSRMDTNWHSGTNEIEF